jgi:cytochrome c biogenesis factor
MDTNAVAAGISSATGTLAAVGGPFGWLLLVASATLAAVALVPALRRWLTLAVGVTVGLLVAGEALLAWFHWTLYNLAVVVDPSTGQVVGRVAVPLWIESEKLYVWALVVGVLTLCVRRHREEMLPWLALFTAGLTVGAVVVSQPFTAPLPGFLGQYGGYLQAMASGQPQAMFGAFQGMLGSMNNYYNAWYMWVHPPLLFLSYGAFVVSFVAIALMVAHRRSAFETTAYGWAKLGYLPLTLGMLLGFPWALMAWGGDSWWWSGKVNMSIMMWLLYTAYLHARLYLRRRGMWRWVAAIALISFAALVLTYITTYLVPGAHSYA